MNEILRSLYARKSVRVFTEEEISAEDKENILNAALQAPSAGCQLLYTILDITDQSKKERLAELCDHQSFIAKAKMALVFCADCRKWLSFYREAGLVPRNPGAGDLLLAVEDAMIAAQNAVTAAESVGIGSCYIGDVMENAEQAKELLGLPEYVYPACMVVFGYPTDQQKERRKPERFRLSDMVYENNYQDKTGREIREMFAGRTGGQNFEGWMEAFWKRKYESSFSNEMNRSMGVYLKDFTDNSGIVEEQKKKIAKLERQVGILEEELHSAEEVNKSKSRFLSNMSHDIRTPMNAIMGMTSIGLSHIDEKLRVQDCLNKVQTASTHLMSLVNDVLDMSRIDSGRLVLNEEPFSLADLIHDVSVIIRPQAVQKKQTFQIEIGRIEEENLLGDPLHLRQILVNIIGNAVKYTQEKGEITVSFSQYREENDTDPEKVWLDFWCKDNGIGMSSEFLERIFVPFERVHNDITRKIEGTGLGMSIVKNLVERMGGGITVESKEGVGSCFTVKLPIGVSLQKEILSNLPEGETVLVVESGMRKAGQIADYLKEGGLSPVLQGSGSQAVTWLTEAQYEESMPCAMLIGDELPDMPSLNLASHVRQLAGREFPIILVSEADWAQLEYRATRAGVNAFVPCPLFKSRLLKVLSDLLGSIRGDGRAADRKKDYSAYRVLLVEDIALNQEIAVELLSMTGVRVEVADDGAQAVEKFEKSPEGYYNIIFMDIHMPVMDGYEATRRIRKMERKDAGKVWIVAMTADAFVEDVRLAKEAGMNEHISKPVEPEHLQDVLYRQLQ